MKLTVSRIAQFNAAHRLFKKEWTDEKNLEVFGKCSFPNYHGHNYKLIVGVTGEVNPETGYVIDLKELKEIIDEQVISRFDHKNLNEDIEAFSKLIPTAENIAIVIFESLRKSISKELKLKITLYETVKNFVEFQG